MRASAHRICRLASLVVSLALVCGVGVASARKAQRPQTVHYHGYVVTVPRSWPVYDLAKNPRVCVRFNRHALYLGTPGAQQRCPAHAAGRTEAILIEPAGASAARTTSGGSTLRLEGSVTSFVVRSAAIEVTATWSQSRGLVARALHRSSLPLSHTARLPAATAARSASASAHAAAAVYTGLGFDACSAPSSKAMSAWGSSPYRALGIYIGGANSACSQPNLNGSWVSSEVAAGWHFIPTYVGLQAPTNSCGCAGINPSQASAQGTAAANNAVAEMQSLGIPAGNPIYDDMESYPRGSTNSSAVLAFLSGWTSGLHAKGYLSGVYSSAGAGITDLVGSYGTGYLEPDDIWIADWNGQQTTSDSYVPSTEWRNHQRLHQYRGGHNETYGGVTINIDNNYLDGATANTRGAPSPPPPAPPTLSVSPTADGTTNLSASWSGGSGLTSWRVLAGDSSGVLTTLATAAAQGSHATITVRSAAPYFAVQALGSAGQILANSSTIASPAHITLYGRSSFVNQATGVGGIPAGCYALSACHIATTVSVGRTTLATTGTESILPASTGILYFKLTPAGRALLLRARGLRLPVQVSAHDTGSGATATSSLSLVPFSTAGRGPARVVAQSAVVHVVGVTDFVFARGAGGILASCVTVAPCRVAATLSVGRTTIAATGSELLGGNELGYLIFSLTPHGRALLARSSGNQLGAKLTLRYGTGAATANIALVQFS
jgi:Domain of unknown function (DUF1906)